MTGDSVHDRIEQSGGTERPDLDHGQHLLEARVWLQSPLTHVPKGEGIELCEYIKH